MPKFNTSHREWITCPHCGNEEDTEASYEVQDSLQGLDSTNLECTCCNKPFIVTLHVEYTWSSEKMTSKGRAAHADKP